VLQNGLCFKVNVIIFFVQVNLFARKNQPLTAIDGFKYHQTALQMILHFYNRAPVFGLIDWLTYKLCFTIRP